MYSSILHFMEKSMIEIEKVAKVAKEVLTGEKDVEDLSRRILDATNLLATGLTGDLYEKFDEEIRECATRKFSWNVERRNEEKELVDIAGTVKFSRTGYKNKHTGEYIYLLDQVLGIDKHQRITLGAAAKVLEETIQSSYRKGGESVNPYDSISKQAVKELVHGTIVEFPLEKKEKKLLRELYIVADEDHVAAQFINNKGDLPLDSRGHKINTIIPKLICVYEGVENESGEKSKNPRYRLVGKRYFCCCYKGEAQNIRFWEEVRDYILEAYDTDVLERVYIAGDGASWIKAGLEVIENSKFVLDKYHIMTYINKSLSHLLEDDIEELKGELWSAINGAKKQELREIYKSILNVTEPGNKYDEVERAMKYFINQWDGIKIRAEEAGGRWKCCAEGQVSHVLSARLSSRPMGWSYHGCEQMAKLRAFSWNGGKVIDLLRYQKEKKRKKGAIEHQNKLIKELRKRQSGWDYEEQMRSYVPGLEGRSMHWLKDVINGGFVA